MGNQNDFSQVIASLPDDVKNEVLSAPPESQKVFFDHLYSQFSGGTQQTPSSGLYGDGTILRKKVIPQFTKGLYEGFRDLPGGTAVTDAIMNFGANSEKKKQVMAETGNPIGMIPALARFAGKVAPDAALMTPFLEGAGMIPKLGKMTKLALGAGAYTGTKDALKGEFDKALPDAAKTAALTYAGGKTLDLAGTGLSKGMEMVGLRKPFISKVTPVIKDTVATDINSAKKEALDLAGQKVDEAIQRFHLSNEQLTNDFGKALNEAGFTNKPIPKPQAEKFFNLLEEKLGIKGKSPEVLNSKQRALLDFRNNLPENASGMDIYNKFKEMSSKGYSREIGAFNDALGEVFPELQGVRSRFANRIQDKRIAETVLNPYKTQSSKYSLDQNNVVRAFNFLKKAASGDMTEAYKRLANATDRFIGGDLFSQLKSHGQSIEAKKAFYDYLNRVSIQGGEDPQGAIPKFLAFLAKKGLNKINPF